jgi:hypothetical protein
MYIQEVILPITKITSHLFEASGISFADDVVEVGGGLAKKYMLQYPGDPTDPKNTQVFNNKKDVQAAIKLFNKKGTKTVGVNSWKEFKAEWKASKDWDALKGNKVRIQFMNNFKSAFSMLNKIVQVLGMVAAWQTHVELQADLFEDYQSGIFGEGKEGYQRWNHASKSLGGIFIAQIAAQMVVAIKAGSLIRKILAAIRLAAAGAATTVAGAIPALLTWLATEAAVSVVVWYLGDRERAEEILAWMYEDGWSEAMDTDWSAANIAGRMDLGLSNLATETGISDNIRQAMKMDPMSDAVEKAAADVYSDKPANSGDSFNDMKQKATSGW